MCACVASNGFALAFVRPFSHRMTMGRKASRLALAIKPVLAAWNTTAADGTYDGYVRGVSDLPATIPNNQDSPIFRPVGKTLWKLTKECLLEKYLRRQFHFLLIHFLLLDIHNDLLSKF